jgi:predicted MFS family arabinose efflux permease
MRRLLCTAFLLLSSVFALRSLVTERMPLLASAFAGGVVMSAFMVAFAPAVARLTGEESRPLGYGIFFSSGIAMGIAGGLVGGHLPDWLSGFSLPGKQAGLFVACALIACAALPSFGLRLPPEGGEAGRVYPRSPLLWRFLAAIALWSLAMGLFNPFFNTYFAHHLNVGVGQVGTVFSIGQVSQVAAMLTAPWILRRIGLVPGIAWMQAAAGVSLAILAVCAAPGPATVIYVSFMAFQWMSEPGMYSVLMKSLKPSEMGTAAALNMTVIGLAQVVAAPVAGMAIDRLGYPPVVGSAGLLAVVAAVLFWALLRRIVYSNSAST